jgi:outer membrane protein assembly factor BamB
MTGDYLWGKKLLAGDNTYGYASSPVVYSNMLCIQYDQDNVSLIYALECASGKTLWEAERNVLPSWASPSFIDNNNTVELITSADPAVMAYDVRDGKKLWEIEGIHGEVAPSPAFDNGILFCGQEYAELLAIDVRSKKVLWKTDEDLPEVASPVAADGYLISPTASGLVTCYASMTGKVLWTFEAEHGIYSSPVIIGKNVYITDLKGNTYVLLLADTKKVFSRNSIHSAVSSTPAFAYNEIYFRTEKQLVCIKNK